MRREVQMVCTNPDCRHEWPAPVDIEYGIANLVRNQDDSCNRCGTESEIKD